MLINLRVIPDGLSGGAIAVIVLLVLGTIAAGAGFIYYLKLKNYEFNKLFGNQRTNPRAQNIQMDGGGFDNFSYVTDPEVQIQNDNLTFKDI